MAKPDMDGGSGYLVQYYEELARLSSGMLAAARLGQWDELTALEGRRAALVNGLKQGDGGAPRTEEADRLRILMESIVAADRETLALAEAWRKELGEMLGSLSVGRRLVRAYAP